MEYPPSINSPSNDAYQLNFADQASHLNLHTLTSTPLQPVKQELVDPNLNLQSMYPGFNMYEAPNFNFTPFDASNQSSSLQPNFSNLYQPMSLQQTLAKTEVQENQELF